MKFTVYPTTVAELHGPTITARQREVISRMTDKQMLTVDFNSVLAVIYLQQSDVPIADIAQVWWDEVMKGAKFK